MFKKKIAELKKGLEGFAVPPSNFVERLHYLWNNNINSSFTISEMAKIFSAVFEVKIHPNTIRPFVKEITVHKAYGNEIPINQKKNRFKYYLQKPVTIHTIEHIQKQRSIKANHYKRRRGSTVIPPTSPSPHKIQSGNWANGKWTSAINLNNSPIVAKKKSLPLKGVIMETTAKQDRAVKVVKYKGISASIRRAINSGSLTGKITPINIRHLLPEGKEDAPSDVILKSLKYLSRQNEIQIVHGEFFTKDATLKNATDEVIVSGKLISTKVENGKILVTVQATCIEHTV